MGIFRIFWCNFRPANLITLFFTMFDPREPQTRKLLLICAVELGNERGRSIYTTRNKSHLIRPLISDRIAFSTFSPTNIDLSRHIWDYIRTFRPIPAIEKRRAQLVQKQESYLTICDFNSLLLPTCVNERYITSKSRNKLLYCRLVRTRSSRTT